MTHVTVVMLQPVRCIYKGCIIYCRTMTARTTCMLRYLTGVILYMRCPVARYATVTQTTITGTGSLRTVGCMTAGTGVMLLIIRRINKTLTSRHCYCMTAGTFAVQGHIPVGRMIDYMIRPYAA